MFSINRDKHVSVEWFPLKPNWWMYNNPFSLKVILCLIVYWFFTIFHIKGNREIGQWLIALVLSFFLDKGFVFAILHFDGKVSSFIYCFIMLVRWIAITGTLSLRNLAGIWFIPEALATPKFFKISSTVATSILCRTKSSHSFRIWL